MKIVIIEDETAAAAGLRALLREVLPDAEVVAVLESVAESVEWLEAHADGNMSPDLLLVDINLADGESFRIFEQVEVECPVIFTTACDQHALEAFRAGGIDYLLKPIRADELRRSVEKLRRLSGKELTEKREKIAFMVHVRDRIVPLRREQIAFFYTTGERVRAWDFEGRAYPIDGSLDRLSKELPAGDFFRANRQFIVSRAAVVDMGVWFGSRLELHLRVAAPERIVVSKERAREFKRWFTA